MLCFKVSLDCSMKVPNVLLWVCKALLPGCRSILQRCRCLQQMAVAIVGSFFSLQLPCGYGGFSLLCGCMSRDASVAEGCWFGVQSLNVVDVDALADPTAVFLADGFGLSGSTDARCAVLC
ncbi:hypothetical protein Nepgr_016431 [Nepenthes gracilis]|uniref:Uncharacterized protein n=1 Tax=Nepenthes gracilis TaxID=150966 RepID=A0AAD3SPS3_NEPGR|nr:hypothetical protein Nepgr_016431 [Nepenthes gracilis]